MLCLHSYIFYWCISLSLSLSLSLSHTHIYIYALQVRVFLWRNLLKNCLLICLFLRKWSTLTCLIRASLFFFYCFILKAYSIHRTVLGSVCFMEYLELLLMCLIVLFPIAFCWKLITYKWRFRKIEKEPMKVMVTGAAGMLAQYDILLAFLGPC